jgi:hypothetical protein
LENVNKNVKFDIFNEINHIINGHEFEWASQNNDTH